MEPHFKTLVHSIPYTSPSSVFKKICQTPPAFLLESSRESVMTGRYSFLGTDPYLTVEFKNNQGILYKKGELPSHFFGNPFVLLRDLLKGFKSKRSDCLPPFFGGMVGFFGYDVVRHFEKLPDLKKYQEGFPDIFLIFVDTLVAFDHMARTAEILHTPSPQELEGSDWETLTAAGKEKISFYLERIGTPSPAERSYSDQLSGSTPDIVPSISKRNFEETVLQCQEYIKAGDIFQANLSQRFTFQTPDRPPILIYDRLQRINPSPFSSFLDGGDFQVVSSSPERLVSLSNRLLSTRPIAGTRPRGRTPEQENQMRSNLICNQKERAEHMMLIDLERNDLGKISNFGSVKVNEFMGIENYSHVIHIVSNIIGDLRPETDWYDVLKAVFPGGTITGVPKIRAMELIENLEPVRRGPYTGSLGYISFSGDLDFNILIRTLFLTKKEGFTQTGAGIVADSIPEKEYDETLQKAEALFEAVDERG